MHVALYRKWRPQKFSEVVGQEHITSILRYEVAESRSSHAYLFCGSRGTGKTTCAKLLAKALNCLAPENGEPCGKCSACLSIDAGTATDVLEMDAASNNGVEYIRDIRDEVVYTPSELKKRVYIIDEVHMLSVSAFNALLKTLEEPPEYVVFILATTELQKIPATIISRCQRFDFRRIPTSDISNRLLHIAENENINLSSGAAYSIARLAEGGMRDAVSMLELCSGNSGINEVTEDIVNSSAGIFPRSRIAQLVDAVAAKNLDTVFSTIAELSAASMDLSVFFSGMMSFYRDMLVLKSTSHPKEYLDLTETELSELNTLAIKFKTEKLLYHSELLANAYQTIQRGGTSARVYAEMTLVKMCDDKLETSNAALLTRISTLEDRFSAIPALAANTNLQNAHPEIPINVPNISESESSDNIPNTLKFNNSPKSSTENVEAALTDTSHTESFQKEAVKTLLGISSWIEIIKKFERIDRGVAAFLARSQAYKVKDSKEIVIRVPDKFSLGMINKTEIKKLLIPLFASYVPGYGTTENEISISVKEVNDPEPDSIDELENFSNN